jgi:DNA replicative helicase MCM subunit Mcm2 (Cdc46/Mcm family)
MWLLLDETDEQNDMRLAAHIINVHQGRVGTAAAAAAAAASSNAAGSSSTVSGCASTNTVFNSCTSPPAFLLPCSHETTGSWQHSSNLDRL